MQTTGVTTGAGEVRSGAAAISGARTTTGTAIVLATARADEGGAAAALRWEDGTVVRRLVDQLASLGVRRALVVTRPEWEAEIERSLDGVKLELRLQACAGLAEDLSAVAEAARAGDESLVVLYGDIVTHGEALAGLLADPRVVTGILAKSGSMRGMPFETRSSRGRVLSAASPYHAPGRWNGVFLGALKIDARDRGVLVEAAQELSELAAPPRPAGWNGELARREERWRLRLARMALRAANGALEGPIELDPDSVVLSETDQRELRRRMAAAEADAASMLLVGLVRGGVHVTNSNLRAFFWARPLSRAQVDEARREIAEYDEEQLLLDTAVKANDGFFTTFFVSPYSKYIARWAARRGWTPNLVTTLSMGVGILAAAAFATGERAGLIAGAVLLQLAFTLDCVDGQLARYTRTFSKLGAWLDSVFDRSKEYLVFAGLAIGAERGFGEDVWALAAAALMLQTARHMLDFSFAATQHRAMATAPQLPLDQPGRSAALTRDEPEADSMPDEPPEEERPGLAARVVGLLRALDRLAWTRWPRKIIAFPIGERFAVVSLTAALWTPRTTFVVLLVWGGVAAVYAWTGRMIRSLARSRG